MGESFPRSLRLTDAKSFAALRAEGVSINTGPFVFQLRVRDEGSPRLGVIASKKVGNAVARHRCKRLFREAFRRNQSVLPTGADVVLIARSSMAEATYGEVAAAFENGLRRALRRWQGAGS